MDRKKNTIRKYLKTNIKIFQLLGLWPEQEKISETSLLWKSYLILMQVFCLGVFNLQQIIYLCLIDDFSLFVATGFSLMSTILASIKAYIFLTRFRLVRKIVNTLDTDNFQPKNTQQEETVRHNFNIQKRINIAFMTIVFGIVAARCAEPFFTNDTYLPYNCWYPYDFKKSPYYELSWIHQLISVYYCCVVIVNFDMFAVTLMIYIGQECDMLVNTVENIEEFTARKVTPQDHRKTIGKSKNFIMTRINSTLIDCIKRHKEILE